MTGNYSRYTRLHIDWPAERILRITFRATSGIGTEQRSIPARVMTGIGCAADLPWDDRKSGIGRE
jgi:hypothetical protein